MSARGEVGYVKNKSTGLVHLVACPKVKTSTCLARWETVPRWVDERPCAYCLPDGLPPEPQHRVRPIEGLLNTWVCACDSIRFWETRSAAEAHFSP